MWPEIDRMYMISHNLYCAKWFQDNEKNVVVSSKYVCTVSTILNCTLDDYRVVNRNILCTKRKIF